MPPPRRGAGRTLPPSGPSSTPASAVGVRRDSKNTDSKNTGAHDKDEQPGHVDEVEPVGFVVLDKVAPISALSRHRRRHVSGRGGHFEYRPYPRNGHAGGDAEIELSRSLQAM